MENWKKYGFEFLTIFIGVFAAFALENWKDNLKDKKIETKILLEIRNGLDKDLEDIKTNENGHRNGIASVNFFKKLIINEAVNQDSVFHRYFFLFRDFITVQNISGYESLKSQGLDIIENDSLRSEIISIYEYDYSVIKKIEEEYSELQFHTSYYQEFNNILAPHFNFNEYEILININQPLKLSIHDRNILLVDLYKIYSNRLFILAIYSETTKKIEKLKKDIDIILKIKNKKTLFNFFKN